MALACIDAHIMDALMQHGQWLLGWPFKRVESAYVNSDERR